MKCIRFGMLVAWRQWIAGTGGDVLALLKSHDRQDVAGGGVSASKGGRTVIAMTCDVCQHSSVGRITTPSGLRRLGVV